MKRDGAALLAFWEVGERLQVLAAITHGDGRMHLCVYISCVVMVGLDDSDGRSTQIKVLIRKPFFFFGIFCIFLTSQKCWKLLV